ncbi:hypothetical protein PIB30_085853 [Stylosanthes scabra]|uniref:Uncharacterized protein n=1 Tax=Stylosanthes scabra TaxID=79078 RepID=A0ABU6RSW8_9FABA|nr:hypothetical protein [Stylosanthes scabra]
MSHLAHVQSMAKRDPKPHQRSKPKLTNLNTKLLTWPNRPTTSHKVTFEPCFQHGPNVTHPSSPQSSPSPATMTQVYESESSVCSATVSAERIRGAVSHIGVLQFLVSEQFFPCEPEEWNFYASEHNLNQRIMRKMLPKAII